VASLAEPIIAKGRWYYTPRHQADTGFSPTKFLHWLRNAETLNSFAQVRKITWVMRKILTINAKITVYTAIVDASSIRS